MRGNLSAGGFGGRSRRRDRGLPGYGGGMVLADSGRGPLPWGKLFVVLLFLLLLAFVQLVRPVPAVEAMPGTGSFTTEGDTPSLPWPGKGSAAVGVSGIGLLAESKADVAPRPIASVAKLMTGLLVVEAKPLRLGQEGPSIEVTAEDVASYERREAEGESTLKVAAGQSLTERQALEGLLVPSGNNIGELLARWVAGSPEAFVKRMNAKAKALGMDHTTFEDVSGLAGGTTSIPRDLLRLGMTAMEHPVIAEIVSMPQAELPVAGVVYNVNYALGQEGIVGVKTGSSSAAGACFVFAATHEVEGRPVTVYGAVMGLPTLEDAFKATKDLILAVKPSVSLHRLVTAGQKMGRYEAPWGATVDIVAAEEVVGVGWPGQTIETRVQARPVKGPLPAGTKVGTVSVRLGDVTQRSPLVTAGALSSAGKGWRLLRTF
jgi:serine-type D-Ala-D-Ala carboxypeptidase (penicillin-binding protein 5/6)